MPASGSASPRMRTGKSAKALRCCQAPRRPSKPAAAQIPRKRCSCASTRPSSRLAEGGAQGGRARIGDPEGRFDCSLRGQAQVDADTDHRASGWPRPETSSIRMPAILWPFTSTSLGHLSWTPSTPSSSSARATASFHHQRQTGRNWCTGRKAPQHRERQPGTRPGLPHPAPPPPPGRSDDRRRERGCAPSSGPGLASRRLLVESYPGRTSTENAVARPPSVAATAAPSRASCLG